MPSRDVKDERMLEETPQETPPPMEFPESQLPLDAAHQRVAVQTILSDFEAAKTARDQREYGWGAKGEKYGFEEWLKELKRLYYGQREPKKEPWQYCSNRSLMIACAILETLHARMVNAVFNEELTHWRPGEVTDAPKAERIEKLMSWWLRVRSHLKEFFDRWTRYTIAMPFTVTETLWDVQVLASGKMVEPPAIPGVEPVESQFQPNVVERTRSDFYPVEDVFMQAGASDIQRDPIILRMRLLYRDLEDMERNGLALNISVASDPSLKALADLLPVDIPNVENLDPDEAAELKRVKLRNQEVTVLKWYGGIDFDGDGFPEEVRLLILPEQQLYISGMPLSALSARGIRPLDATTILPRFDEPHGLWGFGVLEQVRELALEIDAIFNQMTDGNTLSILKPGFYDPSGDLDAPAIKMAPLKMTPLPRPAENLFFPTIEVNTERLLLAIRLVLEFIERLTAASAYVMGKESEIVGGSGTATRTNAIVGASNERHAVPLQRLRDGAARIVTQHLDVLQKNIPPGLEQRVLGMKGEPIFGANELTEEGISGEFDAFLLPDDSMGSKEMERQLAQMLYTTLTQNLIIATDPAKLYKLTADFLKAYGKDPASYLGPAPEIAGAVTPEDEHTMILQGDFKSLKATVTQNPLEHMIAHMGFLQDPALEQLPIPLRQQITDVLMQHIQQHMALLQLTMQAAQSPQKGGGTLGGKSNESQPGGTPGGNAGAAPAVGPEPGLAGVSSPLAKSQQVQRTGESRRPA